MTEPEVHKNKLHEQIEVFGSLEKRSWSEGLDEQGRNKLRGNQTWLKKNAPELYVLEDDQRQEMQPKRCFINEPNCPVRNP